MTKIDRRQALKFGIAGAAGLAAVSVLKEAAAAPPALMCDSRTLILPLPPLELAAGATVFWSTEPVWDTIAPYCLVLNAPPTEPGATAAIVLRRMMVDEEDRFVGLLPSTLSELREMPWARRAFEDAPGGAVDLRGERRLRLNHPLVLELHNPTDRVWHLHGAVFGISTPA